MRLALTLTLTLASMAWAQLEPLSDDDVKAELKRFHQAQPRPAGPVGPMVIHAERLLRGGPGLRLVGQTNGQVQLSADGHWLVYGADGHVFAVPTTKGEPRKLVESAPFFLVTPDSRFVLAPGAAWRRVPLASKDGPIDLAKGEVLHRLAGWAFGRNTLAFLSQEGPMVVTTLDEGTSRRLPVEAPADGRCHAGAGFPRALTSDDEWLVYQHGCSGYEALHLSDDARVKLPWTSVAVVGSWLVGSQQGRGQVEVRDLTADKQWFVEGAELSPQVLVLPRRGGVLTDDPRGRLLFLDLGAKQVRVLSEGQNRVSPFISFTPDEAKALFSTQEPMGCAVHQADLSTSKRQRLAEVVGAQACFIKPLSATRAVLYAWRASTGTGQDAVLATVDLTTGVVRRLGPMLPAAGNLVAEGGAVSVTVDHELYVGRP